jgi:hypothetical protein
MTVLSPPHNIHGGGGSLWWYWPEKVFSGLDMIVYLLLVESQRSPDSERPDNPAGIGVALAHSELVDQLVNGVELFVHSTPLLLSA